MRKGRGRIRGCSPQAPGEAQLKGLQTLKPGRWGGSKEMVQILPPSGGPGGTLPSPSLPHRAV